MRIARVFPRRTAATPRDNMAFIGEPPLFDVEADAVHISVAFTWDLPKAQRLADSWSRIAPVSIGGPATGQRGEEFVPGRYMDEGYTITSRGCPNRCWFCAVWKRDGSIRELPICNGRKINDDNLLACSETHIRSVFAMLARQQQPAEFVGGIEARLLCDWHVSLFSDLPRLGQVFFAYDTPDDWEPLVRAARMMRAAGFTRSKLRAYTLIGYPKDTLSDAETRLRAVANLGVFPCAMLYRNERGERPDGGWRQLQRMWMRPAEIAALLKPKQQEALPLLSEWGWMDE